MNNKKGTKRALVSSLLALLVCVSMLVGTTFAWFTDSVTTGVNTIQSGTLKIDIQDAEGNSLEGETLDFVAKDGRAQDEILWEPGCTYNTEEFYIVNNGTLNLKFKFVISGATGDAKLLEAIDLSAMADASWFNFNTGAFSVSTSGEFDLLKGYDLDIGFSLLDGMHFDEYVLEPGKKVGPIVLSGHMQETAGNEYQGLTVKGLAISLYATQATGEEDSFGGTYDENAVYPSVVTNVAELTQALADGGNIVLANDIDLTQNAETGTVINKDTNLYLNGHTLSSEVLYEKGMNGTQISILTITEGANVTVMNGTVSGGEYAFYVKNGELTVKNGTYFGNTSAVQIGDGATVGNKSVLSIEAGSFSSNDVRYVINCIDGDYKNGEATVKITGGSFYGLDPDNSISENPAGKFVAEGYTSVEVGNVYYVVPESAEVTVGSDNSAAMGTSTTNVVGVNTNGGSIEGAYILDGTADKDEGGMYFRALYGSGITESLSISDSYLQGLYAMNVTTNDDTLTITASNTTFEGWVSYSGWDSAIFTNCTFIGDAIHSDYSEESWTWGSQCRIAAYDDTTLINCEFGENFCIGDREDGVTFTLINCYKNGVQVTAQNFNDLLNNPELNNAYMMYAGDATITVDGIAVQLPTAPVSE